MHRGQALGLHFLHQHLERDLLSGTLSEGFGKRGVELDDLALALALELPDELGDDLLGAHLVQLVGEGELVDLLVVDVCPDVGHDVVTAPSRMPHSLQLGESVAKPVEELVHVLLGHLRGRKRHGDVRVVVQGQPGPDLHGRGEHEGTALLHVLDVDVGLRDRGELILADGSGVVGGDGLLDELLQNGLPADLRNPGTRICWPIRRYARSRSFATSSGGTSTVSLTVWRPVSSTVLCITNLR